MLSDYKYLATPYEGSSSGKKSLTPAADLSNQEDGLTNEEAKAIYDKNG